MADEQDQTTLERPEDSDDDKPRTIREQVKEAVDARDAEGIEALLEPLPLSGKMRQLLALNPEDRDHLLNLVDIELAADLVEEAPHETATELVERMDAARAADVLEELDSDLQADLIGDLDEKEAEAILNELDPEDAADVRRLVAYDDETAGGLMVAETFAFADTATVGTVLRGMVSEDDDFERYRGQHPYVTDAEGRPVGVVSLRGLLTSKRSDKLTEVMTTPMTVDVGTSLDDLQDIFDGNNFLGLPVVEADGKLVGVVSRSAVAEAALERSESESLKRQG
ncbi:MAG: CBS domain-containing protein, partial [Silicimonas sp.]|nr:CBS domain-containing protein [Silicimonas sp.]